MAIEKFPPARAGAEDDTNFRNYPGGALGPDAQMKMIGGTHNVSTRLDPETCLTGGYQGIAGDTMPAGAPIDKSSTGNNYLPKN